MKLHTDFHDYYDAAIGYGIDENVHYSRFTREVEINLKHKLDFPSVSYSVSPLLLGFCGEIYPVLALSRPAPTYQTLETFYAYNYEELTNKRAEWKPENYRSFLKVTQKKYRTEKRESATRQFFIDWRERDDRLFLEHKTPVWMYKLWSADRKIFINPKLETYGFDRVKDATTAFQEISVYLSNILIERKEISVVEDKYRIERHGFDLKKSFRKEKRK